MTQFGKDYRMYAMDKNKYNRGSQYFLEISAALEKRPSGPRFMNYHLICIQIVYGNLLIRIDAFKYVLKTISQAKASKSYERHVRA